MNFPDRDLSLQHISQSYQNLLQGRGQYVVDGFGNAILDVGATGSGSEPVSLLRSAQTASMVVASASLAGVALYAEVAATASTAIVADVAVTAVSALTASYLQGSIESASYSGYAVSSSLAASASYAVTASYAEGYLKKTGDTATGDIIGTDFIKTRSGTITRNISGEIEQVAYSGGRTLSITRTGGYISSITDGVRTWTYTRNGNNDIVSWTVT